VIRSEVKAPSPNGARLKKVEAKVVDEDEEKREEEG
jgi:hypothetical protein